jgi:hypothetical protein
MIFNHPYFKIADNTLEKIKRPIYVWGLFIIHVLYTVVFLGIITVNEKYIHYFSSFIQVFIACFLIIRFFPYRSHYLKDFDSEIIFGCGIFLFSNVFFTELAKWIDLDSIQTSMRHMIHVG